MDTIYDYYQINTMDIWPFEAYQFLNRNRTDHLIYRLKSILESQIIKKRKEQIQLNETITIEPFVTVIDYNNNTHREYWIRHTLEIQKATCLIDQVRINYFNIIDNNVDSFFSLSQDILIERDNDNFDFWFTLKLGQYKSGLKYLNNFLSYHLIETFESDIEKYELFLNILLKQYGNEILNGNIIDLTKEWISEHSEKKNNTENANNKRSLSGQLSTFYLKKVEEKPLFLINNEGLICIQETLFLLKKNRFIMDNTTTMAFSNIFRGKALVEKDRIIWIGTLVELKWFVEMIISENVCVEINGIDKWLIAQNCFLYQNRNNEIKKIDNYKSISDARGKVTKRKDILNNILKILFIGCNSTPTE